MRSGTCSAGPGTKDASRRRSWSRPSGTWTWKSRCCNGGNAGEKKARRARVGPADLPASSGGRRADPADDAGLPGVSGYRLRRLGPPTTLSDLRACRLLRLIAVQARHRALSGDRTPGGPLVPAGGVVAVVLRGRVARGWLI